MGNVNKDLLVRVLWDIWQDKHYGNPFTYIMWNEHGQAIQKAALETYPGDSLDIISLEKAWDSFIQFRMAAGLPVICDNLLLNEFIPWAEAFCRWGSAGVPWDDLQSGLWRMWLEKIALENQPREGMILDKAYKKMVTAVTEMSKEDLSEHEQALEELDNAMAKEDL